jgi:predicted kinase
VRELTESHLRMCRDRIESRAAQDMPCETHGDLHLDHVYQFPDAAPPDDLLMIDCIEFADRFRYADPIADMAFLAMDLTFHGRRDLARSFIDQYIEASGDRHGRELVRFYSAYRAVVRAKVEGMELGEKEIDAEERRQAQQRAKAHWLLALGELAEPGDRPALVMMAGLPGSGKSTLAGHLAEATNFAVLRGDVIRKELAGDPKTAANFGEGIYTDAWTDRTYGELLRQCEARLEQGERVVIDANFRDDRRRQTFLAAARRWAVPCVFIHCQAAREVVRARLQARHGDASDADWSIYEQLERTWQPLGSELQEVAHSLDTSGSIEGNLDALMSLLRKDELACAAITPVQ